MVSIDHSKINKNCHLLPLNIRLSPMLHENHSSLSSAKGQLRRHDRTTPTTSTTFAACPWMELLNPWKSGGFTLSVPIPKWNPEPIWSRFTSGFVAFL